MLTNFDFSVFLISNIVSLIENVVIIYVKSEETGRRTDRWMGGWVDGWVDGWMDGRTDGRTERQTDRPDRARGRVW
jgi:hypothetical protein